MKKPSPHPDLSVIVPAYGEERTITQDIKRLEETLKKIRYSYEIIVVVDGRRTPDDRSYEHALAVSSKTVRVYGYEVNRGKGYAVRYGMARSSGNIVAFIDSGMEISPNSFSLALEHFEWYKADVIIGSKRHPASRVHYPLTRKILSVGYQCGVWVLFGLKVRDTQVGMKIFRRELLERVLPRLLVKRYAFDVEMLAVAYALGYRRMYEAPVEFHYDVDFTTNSANIRTILRMAWDTCAVYYRLVILRYYSAKNQHKWHTDTDVLFHEPRVMRVSPTR